MNKCISKR